MKCKIFIPIFVIIVCLFNLNAELVEVYKKGIIKIQPDPNFGTGLDWESLFYDYKKDLLVAPDSNVYVSNLSTHNIYKFNPDGKLIGTYGKEGRGPGDLYRQSLNSILDGKYLVIPDYASFRKISVFDLSGKCVSTIRTKTNCMDAVGLKKGSIAYYSEKNFPDIKKGKMVSTVTVHIINMNTKEETEFVFGNIVRGVIPLSGTYQFYPGNYFGSFILRQTRDGNLLAGISDSPDMKIYTPGGKLIKNFRLNIQPIPVTAKYIENKKKATINDLQNEVPNPGLFKRIKKAVEQSDFKNFFGQYLPYYKSFIVDSEGNILVFKWLDSEGKPNETFQVYSPGGDYLCETILDAGTFDININSNFQTIQFTSHAIYGIFKIDDEDDINIRLLKVKL